jgi:hypothetical protein
VPSVVDVASLLSIVVMGYINFDAWSVVFVLLESCSRSGY